MTRYAPSEVRAALLATDRYTYTPHDQIVLAAEVRALQALIVLVAGNVDTASAQLESEAINAAVALAPEFLK